MASILDVCAIPGTLHSATLGGPVAQRQREPLPHSLDHSLHPFVLPALTLRESPRARGATPFLIPLSLSDLLRAAADGDRCVLVRGRVRARTADGPGVCSWGDAMGRMDGAVH